jgi:hypothetical protein
MGERSRRNIIMLEIERGEGRSVMRGVKRGWKGIEDEEGKWDKMDVRKYCRREKIKGGKKDRGG